MRTHLLASALIACLGAQAQSAVQRTYAADGTVRVEEYQVGERMRHVVYHPNGQVSEKGWLTESGPDGTWKQYDATGNLLVKGHFTAGNRSGHWVVRDPANGHTLRLKYENQALAEAKELDGSGTLLAEHDLVAP